MRTLRLLILLILLGSILWVAPASGALTAYLELTLNGNPIEGEPSVGNIGGVDVSGMIPVHAFRHELLRALASGRTGKLAHKPVVITKPMDKATPLLYQAINTNATGTGILRFFRSNPEDGTTEEYLTITLSNLQLLRVQPWMPSNLDPASANLPPLEEITLTYQSIRVTHSSGTEVELDQSTAN